MSPTAQYQLHGYDHQRDAKPTRDNGRGHGQRYRQCDYQQPNANGPGSEQIRNVAERHAVAFYRRRVLSQKLRRISVPLLLRMIRDGHRLTIDTAPLSGAISLAQDIGDDVRRLFRREDQVRHLRVRCSKKGVKGGSRHP
jgi:hypothetical protein